MMLYNAEFILSILVFLGIFFLILFGKNGKKTNKQYTREYFRIDHLTAMVKQRMDEIQMMNPQELNLSRSETKKREERKAHLRKALRECNKEKGSRRYVIEFIKELLQTELQINEESILWTIRFEEPWHLSSIEQFIILYVTYFLMGEKRIFEELCERYGWDREKTNEEGKFYEVTAEEIQYAFLNKGSSISYQGKLECVAQLIYQKLYGLDVCDVLIFDESIDDCAAGCGGTTLGENHYLEEMMKSGNVQRHNYDSVWIIYHGKKILLSFLTFGNQKNLERVVKSLACNEEGRMLTRQNGYMLLNTEKHRIAVARPPHSASWAFYVRNLNSVQEITFQRLFPDKGNDKLERVIAGLMKANQSFIITGDQASGKTTTLRSLLRFIDQRLSIRAVEAIFEIQANNLLPGRNTQLIQEIGNRSLSEAITFLKKTNTDVTILGELDETRKAGLLIQICQTGGLFTISTSHHRTTKKLVEYLRNALLEHTNLSSPFIAENQVVDSIHFDIHQEKDKDGKRYIRRITEIIPNEDSFDAQTAGSRCYELQNIIEWRNGEYHICHKISLNGLQRIKEQLTEEEYNEFTSWMNAEYEKTVQKGGGRYEVYKENVA